MKKSIVIGMIISGVSLLAAMVTAGAAEDRSTQTRNSVVSEDFPDTDVWDPTQPDTDVWDPTEAAAG